MQISFENPDFSARTTVIPVLKDNRDTIIDTLAERLAIPLREMTADFSGDAGETLPIFQPGGGRVFLLGLGEKPGSMDYLKAFRKLFFDRKAKLPASVAVDLTTLGDVQPDAVEAIVTGILTAHNDIGRFKTDRPDVPAFFGPDGQLALLVRDEQRTTDLDGALTRAQIIADTTRQMIDLMNAPGNHKPPTVLADWAVQSGEHYGYTVRILDRADLEAEGLHALLSVNQGSDQPPVLIICDYQPKNPQSGVPVVGLVGKGVTFDTGGISIKPSTNMHYMKSDMGGAAAVLGTVETAARLGLPMRVIGIVPATENMVDGSATKPGDVVGSYLGKTIEVIDTDAEGRIILADGLGYMIRNYKPDTLIDLATLTGSVITTLGYAAAGLFTQNDTLAAQLAAAGDRTGERLWRLPLWDAYKDDLKSDVADVKNYSGKPLAGAITAAKFLELFTENHPAWAHLDIAGMAFADTEFGHQKNGTGYGIRLLTDFLRQLVIS